MGANMREQEFPSMKQMKSKHTNFKIEACVLTVHPEYPWLHATPDFVCSCECCGQGCCEVKCPYCLKDIDFHQYVQRRTSCFHLDKFRLKKDHQYYYQVQQQLFSTGSAVPARLRCRRAVPARLRCRTAVPARLRCRGRVEDAAPYRTDNGRGMGVAEDAAGARSTRKKQEEDGCCVGGQGR
ncbi:hypothetical protein Bbelb_291940 [Branchiostoma belcheri]|nr:hypothetical protein Bbelb_291940 [Branchiostoma belcheri]